MRRPATLQVLGAVYLIWRALRSLNSGWNYFYSIPFWCAVPYCHALAPARMPACLHARRHWGSPGGWPAVMHAAAAAATNLVATRVRSGLLTWPAMCRLSRLAEFMAYCLSYCFVTSLFYMVSWRQQSAQAGARANGWRNRICFACSGAHLPARHTATCAAACTAACTAASATLRRSHCRATGRPRQCLVMPCQCLTTPCKCPASALPLPCQCGCACRLSARSGGCTTCCRLRRCLTWTSSSALTQVTLLTLS